MCIRKLVITNRICLGNRELCFEAYSLPKGEVVELTSNQLKHCIKNGTDEVYGLELDTKTDRLVLSKSFFTTNLMNKIHTGVLTPMEESETVANIFYLVIGTHKEGDATMYDVISSRYERNSFSAEKVKTLIELGIITSGAKLEHDKIIVAPLEKPSAPKAEKPTSEKKATAEKEKDIAKTK